MNKYDLKFNHLGLAVKNKPKAINFLLGLGYNINSEIYDPLQKVMLTMCTNKEHPNVELICSAEENGPLDIILKTREAQIYHMCYSTENLKKVLNKFSLNNIRVICISSPKKAVLFGDNEVSFYYIGGFGLVEILCKQ